MVDAAGDSPDRVRYSRGAAPFFWVPDLFQPGHKSHDRFTLA